MDNLCSFNAIGSTVCGGCRGESGIRRLEDCDENIQNHLSSCRLSRSGFSMREISSEEIRSMTVCPNHRYNLGRYWRPRLTCQHPSHTAPARRCKGKDVINLEVSRDVFQIYGVLAQVGSRK
jgi:hypothetical protein